MTLDETLAIVTSHVKCRTDIYGANVFDPDPVDS